MKASLKALIPTTLSIFFLIGCVSTQDLTQEDIQTRLTELENEYSTKGLRNKPEPVKVDLEKKEEEPIQEVAQLTSPTITIPEPTPSMPVPESSTAPEENQNPPDAYQEGGFKTQMEEWKKIFDETQLEINKMKDLIKDQSQSAVNPDPE